jgi:hypothetical protein
MVVPHLRVRKVVLWKVGGALTQAGATKQTFEWLLLALPAPLPVLPMRLLVMLKGSLLVTRGRVAPQPHRCRRFRR